MATPKDILLLKKLWESGFVSHNLLDAPLKTYCKEIVEGKKASLGEVLVRLGVVSSKQLQTLEEQSQQLLKEIAPQQFTSLPPNINTDECTDLQKLGSSALGNTYQASHEKLGQCTIKYIEGILAINRKFLKRFFLQVQKLVGLTQENIATNYHASHEKLEIIREYVPGHNLEEHIKESTISLASACDIVLQAAKGLNFAYQNGIVHKNLKPTNIIITPEGKVKIVDFSLPPTMPNYLSPEQCQKQKSDVRSDIYTLGLMFYYLLTDRPAIQESSSKEIMSAIISSSFIDKNTDNLPENVCNILRKMTTKSPADRYTDYIDLISDLEDSSPRKKINTDMIEGLMHTAEIALSVDERQELFLNDTVDAIPEPYEADDEMDDQMTLEAEEVSEEESEEKSDSMQAVSVKSDSFPSVEDQESGEIKISDRPLPKFNVQEIKKSPEVKNFELEDNSEVNESDGGGSILPKENKLKPYFLRNLKKNKKE